MAYEVPGLHVKITGDNSSAKKSLKELQTELAKTKWRIDDLKMSIEQAGKDGYQWTPEYKGMVKELEEAEQQYDDLTDAIKRYNKESNSAGEATQESTQKMRLLGSNVASTIGRMFGLMKIIQETKQALDDFQENNPNSPITESIQEAKDSWAELKEDLIQEAGPLIIDIADMVKMINEQSKPINETVGHTIKMLEESGLIDFLQNVLWATNNIVMGPIKLLNLGLEQINGKTSKVKLDLKDINVEFKDLTKYYDKLNKSTEKRLFLLGGFDELNVLSKEKEEVENQEEAIELQEYYNELKQQETQLNQEIADIWKAYADELGISVDDYQRLWSAWKDGNVDEFTEIVGQLGLNFSTAKNNMEAFAADDKGWQGIQTRLRQVDTLKTKIEEVIALYGQLVGIDNATQQMERERLLKLGKTVGVLKEDGTLKNTWEILQSFSTPTVKGISDYREDIFSGMGTSDYRDDIWSNFNRDADGGVYTSPAFNIVGEYAGASNNPEIVTPQDMMMETFLEAQGPLADVIAQAASQVVSAIAQQNLEVTIGDSVIAESAARGNRNYYNMTGSNLIGV